MAAWSRAPPILRTGQPRRCQTAAAAAPSSPSVPSDLRSARRAFRAHVLATAGSAHGGRCVRGRCRPPRPVRDPCAVLRRCGRLMRGRRRHALRAAVDRRPGGRPVGRGCRGSAPESRPARRQADGAHLGLGAPALHPRRRGSPARGRSARTVARGAPVLRQLGRAADRHRLRNRARVVPGRCRDQARTRHRRACAHDRRRGPGGSRDSDVDEPRHRPRRSAGGLPDQHCSHRRHRAHPDSTVAAHQPGARRDPRR